MVESNTSPESISKKLNEFTGLFDYDLGDEIVKQDSGVRIEGVGAVGDTTTVYTVKRRVISPDSGKAFYQLEWEEEDPHSSISPINIERMLVSAKMAHNTYRLVDY